MKKAKLSKVVSYYQERHDCLSPHAQAALSEISLFGQNLEKENKQKTVKAKNIDHKNK